MARGSTCGQCQAPLAKANNCGSAAVCAGKSNKAKASRLQMTILACSTALGWTTAENALPKRAKRGSKVRVSRLFMIDTPTPHCVLIAGDYFLFIGFSALRSEERRVGKECRSRFEM